ncbi:MAG: RsmB/NOP family class I SAM-dependent RNA methyltransferase, partial [Bdellovibrionales bacterium]|nr:RsmB/NOP family class I SAM-dependent RNA methyltransferase [Bdellovibrionales bacterium]
FLRVNILKTSAEKLRDSLAEENIEAERVANFPNTLQLKERKPVFKTKPFLRGEFEVQDGGSQQIAEFLRVEPGEFVIDACAGAGGKTLHLSSLLQNRGRVLALDVHASKLSELEKRARRASASNVETRAIESTKTIKRLKGVADRLLLDVPCTGTGVIRRSPDTKWRVSPHEIEALTEEQQEILKRYTQMVKPGGTFVYSTCSLLPLENAQQIKDFLENHPGYELEEEKTIKPTENGFDGFYMARLKAPLQSLDSN